MSAARRHHGKIKLIHECLSNGPQTTKQIFEYTGVHEITIEERLIEAQIWGAVVYYDGLWELRT